MILLWSKHYWYSTAGFFSPHTFCSPTRLPAKFSSGTQFLESVLAPQVFFSPHIFWPHIWLLLNHYTDGFVMKYTLLFCHHRFFSPHILFSPTSFVGKACRGLQILWSVLTPQVFLDPTGFGPTGFFVSPQVLAPQTSGPKAGSLKKWGVASKLESCHSLLQLPKRVYETIHGVTPY